MTSLQLFILIFGMPAAVIVGVGLASLLIGDDDFPE